MKERIRGLRIRFATAVYAALFFAAGASAQNLFVPCYDNNNNATSLCEFTPAGVQTTFASGLPGMAYGPAFNRAGSLLMSEMNAPFNIVAFTPAGTESTYASGLFAPVGMAFDNTGDLFVSEPINNGGSMTGDIIKITPGGVQSIFVDNLGNAGSTDGPSELAFDKGGDLFVSGYQGIFEFTNYNGTLSSNATVFFSGASGFQFASGLAFDGAGNLFVAEQGDNPGLGMIYEFTNNAGTLSTNPVAFASGLSLPWGLAFNSAGHLFEADQASGNVYEFAPDGTRSTFASGLSFPEGVGFEPVPELAGISSNGTFQLTVTMPSPYCPTIVQVSTNLVNWTSLCTNTPAFVYTDSMVTTFPCRYYRALLAPFE